MDAFETYNTISESLQCDINDGSISFEYASILNDIAYDIYVEGVNVNEGVANILDKYVTEACAFVDSTDNPDVDMDHLYESAMELLNKITEAYENDAITAAEMDSLLESVNAKIDAYDALVESGTNGTIKNDEIDEDPDRK